ncbi:MAG: phycobiliprotein lyase [Prochloron sp. SP5CPC1]|nr:phycobiliprotein lyase [Candidatus Paraprochloron terpiosi SP5CPC1]
MNITKFVEMSIGSWRSQRSAHHMAFQQFEAVTSNLEIEAIATDDPAVIDLCKSHQIDPKAATAPFRMTWEGESDWDEDEEPPYDRAMAEEKIWFATPNLRFRVSLIKTSAGSGVITASFASEIRSLIPKNASPRERKAKQ